MKVTIEGSIADQVDAAVRDVARGLRRAVTATGKQVQAQLRAQARSAGFRDGGRAVANAWRLSTYPASPAVPTWRPAALVFSKMPDVVDAFDSGKPITVKNRRYLAIPTPINAPNRRSRLRVTPQEMLRSGGFIRPSRNPRVRLWCLPLRTETTKRGRLKVFAGRYTEVLTGRVKGLQERRRQFAAERSFVVMFLLVKQVSLRKRLDVDGVARGARGLLAENLVREMNL